MLVQSKAKGKKEKNIIVETWNYSNNYYFCRRSIRQAMKKLILLAACISIAAGVFAQNYTNKEFALINYDLKITDALREDIQHLDTFMGTVEIHNKNAEDRLKAILIHHLYYNMKPVLERKLDLSILPINSFMQRIRYDEFGYPRASISKALRKGDSPYYFKVEIKLDSQTQEKREQDPELPDKITFPQYTIDLTIYNDEGILPIDHWHGGAKVEEPIQADKTLFGDFIDQQNIPSDSTHPNLSVLHQQAVNNMINSHLNE